MHLSILKILKEDFGPQYKNLKPLLDTPGLVFLFKTQIKCFI